MQIPKYLKKISTEREARLKSRFYADPNAKDLWKTALNSINTKEDHDLLFKAYKFGKAVEYSHDGMTSEIYFMHPLRVASYSLLCKECVDVNFGILGLLHNVLELSEISLKNLKELFGESISNQIEALTVDRTQQWDSIYKKKYYKLINSNPLSCRVIKIFDKLDNLFILGVNPDDDVRKKYINEIKLYILPMAERDLPSIYPYLYELTKDVESIGFFKQ